MDGNAARRHFGAADYLAAARLAPRPGHALVGQAVDASWDEAQTPAMLEQRVPIAEEAVAALLLQDLDSR